MKPNCTLVVIDARHVGVGEVWEDGSIHVGWTGRLSERLDTTMSEYYLRAIAVAQATPTNYERDHLADECIRPRMLSMGVPLV